MYEPVYDVAIVVPIFNVEEYLQESLESLAAQTMFDRCQVILVDNGSSDSSPQIAAAFAERHLNVWAYTYPYGKAGGARNAGMDVASAHYIAFCDSDDILPDTAIETLWRTAAKERAPLTIGRMETFPAPTEWPWLKYFGSAPQVYPGIENIPDMIYAAGPAHKLFDLDFIRRNNLRFQEGVHFEDAFFVVPSMLLADRIAVVPETVYQYRKRATGDSTMDHLWDRKENYWDHLALEEHVLALRPRLSGHRQEVADRFLVRTYQGFALRAPDVMTDDELWQLFERCRNIYARMTPDTIMRSTIDTRHRVPFLALYLNSFELFARPGEVVRGVYGRGTDLYLDVPVPGELLPLAKVTAAHVHLERVRAVKAAGGLVVSGRFAVNGLPLNRPLHNQLKLWIENSGRTVPARVMRRGDLLATREDLEWGGFEAVVPVGEFKDGEFPLKLVFCTQGRDVSRPCMTTTALLRGARSTRVADRRVLPVVRGKNHAALVVRDATTPASRKAWRSLIRSMDRDQRKRRAPFWRARLIRLATRPLFARREVWLFGERKDTAQDNGWHLFRYARQVEKRRGAYYVIDKDSPDRTKLKKLGHVVAHSSWKHKLLMLHASVLINAYDIDAYMIPDDWDRTSYLRHLSWRVGARRVFLQHGVLNEDASKGLHRNRTGVDLALASSVEEGRFFAEYMDYRDQVQVLGLPRFDALQPDRGHRRILFMPTWRSYLAAPSYVKDGDEDAARARFEASHYREFLVGLLHDPRLHAALERHDYVFEFLPHYEMRNMVDGVLPEQGRVRRLDQRETGVQDALRGCDLFITDWSSVMFDVAYLGTPLVHAQFDPDQYWGEHSRRSWFDAERDGFGPVCGSVDEVIDQVIRYLESGCVREPEYTRRAQKVFAYQDRGNCARASRAIAQLTRAA
ncbi:CDP-glycerol glycerophosphotransferase family protein [Streptomyces sp. NPDC059009]|uniref:bifunctional glycosyltransferase/CDP-glycerol:glycerophosphate glycerophosphotransferase n=1 Tax=Streptomyces sp. NPDC059009 TaxID=3346694 RepID=UPI0036C96E84